MRRCGGLLATMMLLVAMPAGADEPEERESEFELPPGEAWRQHGFRVQIRVGHERLSPEDAIAPGAAGLSFAVEPGIRISDHFSLSAQLRYAALSGGLNGVRFSTSGDLAWHPFSGLFLAGGVGYAGLFGSRTDTGQRELYAAQPQCDDGSGVVVLARAGWLFPLGELFATGPVVQLDQQWTRCETPRWAIESDDGEHATVSHPESFTWRHRSLLLSWSFAWR